MITFIPKRPEVLTAKYWRSKVGDAALDEGFERYCELYNEYTERYSFYEAERMACQTGLYTALLCLLIHAEEEETNADNN